MSLIINYGRAAGLATVLLCTLLGCAAGPQKTDAQRQTDNETAARVQDALDSDKLLYARHITVRADTGVVHLSGFVWDPPDLDEAQRIAEGVAGVSKVVNDLELQRNGLDDSPVVR